MILPLNENNHTIIELAVAHETKVDFPCLNLATNKLATFKVEKLDGAYRFEISNFETMGSEVFYSGHPKLFVEIAVKFLKTRQMRIFSPEQPYSMLEWISGLICT